MSKITRTITTYTYAVYKEKEGLPVLDSHITLDHEIKDKEKKNLGIEMAILTGTETSLYEMETTDFVLYGSKVTK